jgi:hypothetical protein
MIPRGPRRAEDLPAERVWQIGDDYLEETATRLCEECNRLLGLWRDMASKGGRDSIEAGRMHRERIAPLLRTILRQPWDWDDFARFPHLAKAIDVMTRPV